MPSISASTNIQSIQLKESSAPSTPASGYGRLYFKTDNTLHILDDTGADLNLSALTTVGALNAGSITSGFGTINIGSDTLTAGAGTFSGLLTVSGLGTHSFSGTGTGGNVLSVTNTTAGTGNYAQISVTEVDGYGLNLYAYSSTYTPTTFKLAHGTALYADGVGGLSIVADNASGVLRFYAGGTTLQAKVETTGTFYTNDGTVSSLSDARTKQRVGNFTAGLEAIRALMVEDDGALGLYVHTGDVATGYPQNDRPFVSATAQKIQRAVPEAVTAHEDGYLTVTTSPVFWAGLRAIDQLAARLDRLEGRA